MRQHKSRRHAVGARVRLAVIAQANERWSLDFVHDQLVGGWRCRVLNIMDDVTRECLAAVADRCISNRRVVRELAALVVRRGEPTQDGTVESINGRIRDEMLSETLFTSLAHPRRNPTAPSRFGK